MNIIFLDVDGVLNSAAYFKRMSLNGIRNFDEITELHLQNLAKIYNACDAKIVLSSTWRELDDKDAPECYAMYEYLINSLKKYDMEIIGKTPVIDMNRPLEIKTWLDSREDKENISFISLDDDHSRDEYDAYGIGDCLVHTVFFCDKEEDGGLQQSHVNLAIAMLNKVQLQD